MKHKTFLAVVVLAFTMAGCKLQKKSEASAAKQAQTKLAQVQPKQVNTRPLRLDDVYAEFEGQLQPNVYNLIFSWPETADRVRISADGQVMFAVKTYERSKEGIANLQGGRKISILVEILDEKYHVITSEVRDLEVPKDYVFPNEFKLTGNMTISNERVFLNNSIITTANFNLVIQTKKLIVLDKSTTLEKSRIQNFTEGTRANHGSNGRNGGLIAITADAAEGDLTFIMNSEAGGDALRGFIHKRADIGTGAIMEDAICVFGSNGFAAGRNGDLNLKIKDIANFRPYAQETLSDGGRLAPMVDNSNPGYPSLTMTTLGMITCPKRPSVGAGATTGKICMTFSGQTPAQGCE